MVRLMETPSKPSHGRPPAATPNVASLSPEAEVAQHEIAFAIPPGSAIDVYGTPTSSNGLTPASTRSPA
jgi:hypothetical protein